MSFPESIHIYGVGLDDVMADQTGSSIDNFRQGGSLWHGFCASRDDGD